MKTGASDMSESYIVSAGETTDGTQIDSETCRDIFELATTQIQLKDVQISSETQNLLKSQITARQNEVKDRNTTTYLDKKDLLERQYQDKIIEFEMKIDSLKAKVKDKERQERQAGNAQEKLKIANEKQTIRKKMRQLNHQKFDLEDRMDYEIADKITLAQQASESGVNIEPLFKIGFSITR